MANIEWVKHKQTEYTDTICIGDTIEQDDFVVNKIVYIRDVVEFHGPPKYIPIIVEPGSTVTRLFWTARSNTDPHAD